MSFKFTVGDYVVADRAMFDNFDGIIFKVVRNGYNMIGHRLVHVVDIATMNTVSPKRACFYEGELTYEDGSRP